MMMAAAGVDVEPVGSVGAGVEVVAGVGDGDGVAVDVVLDESSVCVERQKVLV